MSVLRSTSASFPRRDITVPLLATPYLQNYLAPIIAPAFFTPGESGKVPRITYKALRQTPRSLVRSKGGAYQETNFVLDEFSYATKDRGLEFPVDDTDRANYGDLFDLDMTVSELVRNAMMIRREYELFAQLYNESNWTASGNTGLTVSTPWTTAASATPISDINNGLEGLVARGSPLTDVYLVVNHKQYRALCACTQVLDRLRYTDKPGALLPTSELASLFGIAGILVGDATRDSAAEGQTATPGYIQSNTYAALVRIQSGQGTLQPCSFRNFVWNDDGGEMTVEQYRDEKVRADRLRMRNYSDDTIIETSNTFLFKSVA